MFRTFSFVILLLILIPFGIFVFAQTNQTASKTEQDPTAQLQTALIEIHAVVTDKQGHHIGNLKKEDFELTENKNPQQISFFNIENMTEQLKNPAPERATSNPGGKGSVPVGAPVRTVAIYLDTLNLSTQSLLQTKQTLNKFIDEQLTDHDLAAVITSTGALGVLEQFTRDKKILHYAVSRLNAGLSSRESLFTPYIASLVQRDDRDGIAAAISILQSEEHANGSYKVLAALADARASEVLSEASYRRRYTLFTLKAVAERLSTMPGQRIIAMLSDGFSLMGTDGSHDTHELESATSRAVQSGIFIYSIDAKGLTPPSEFNASSPGGNNPLLSNRLSGYLHDSEEDAHDSLNALARDTGGEHLFNSNDIGGLLKRALDDNQIYYSLAYYPTGETDIKRFRNIVVKVKDHPEYIVRTQKGYSPKELIKAKAEEAKTPEQKLGQAMESPLPVTEIEVAATADFLGREGDPSEVILEVYIDAKNVQFREEEKRFRFDLDVATAIYDSKGKPVITKSDQIKGGVSPDELELAKKAGFDYTKVVSLKPGLYQARVGVREASTEHIGTALAWINVPNIARNKLAISGVFLSEPTSAASSFELNPTITPQSAIRQGIRFYKPGGSLVYSARIYNVESSPTHGTDLMIHIEIVSSGNTVYQNQWQPLSSRTLGKDGTAANIGGQIKLGLKPGIYELHLQIKDQKSKHPTEQTVIFGVDG